MGTLKNKFWSLILTSLSDPQKRISSYDITSHHKQL